MGFSDFLQYKLDKTEVLENAGSDKMTKTILKRIAVLSDQNAELLNEAQHSAKNLKEISKILKEASKKADAKEMAEVLLKTRALNKMKGKNEPIDIDLANFVYSVEQFLKNK